MKPLAYSGIVFVLSVFAGRLLSASWDVDIVAGSLLAATAAAVLVMVALVIRSAGKEELGRKRIKEIRAKALAYQAGQDEGVHGRKCASCWGPLQRPFVHSEGKFIGLACCERRKSPDRDRIYFPKRELDLMRQARRAGL